MKFTCEKALLVSAISVASRTVAQKSAITALEGILVRAGTRVMLTGFNLETGITVGLSADVTEEGECIMPARLFFDIIRKLPDDIVSVSVDEKMAVSIRGGISSFSISATRVSPRRVSTRSRPAILQLHQRRGLQDSEGRRH